MTRCVACDANLNDFESTRKIIYEDGKIEYPDLCNTCYKETGLGEETVVIERHDLNHTEDITDDGYDYYDGEY